METKLKNQALDLTTRLESKVYYFTRDISLTTDLAITGIGFKPTVLIAVGAIGGTDSTSVGFSSSNKDAAQLVQYATNTFTTTAKLLSIAITGSDYTDLTVKSYDADGFTLASTKTGSPTGTGNIYILCLR